MPIYPERALKERVRGAVVVNVLVSETGVPLTAEAEEGARPDLASAAVAAALEWRFEPARKNGRAVRTVTKVRFAFEGVQFARTPFPLNPSVSAPGTTPTPSRRAAP